MLLNKVLVAAALVAAASAGATPLPEATYYYHFDNQNQMDGAVGSYASGGSHVTFGLTPSPSITLGASNDGVSAGLKYYFRINGPDNVIVPIRILGKLRANSAAPTDGQANAAAQIDVNGLFFSPTAFIEHDAGFYNAGLTSADPLLMTTEYTNSPVLVWLRASINAGKGSGTAFADPIISIDPSFAAQYPNYLSDFTLEFSVGAGNSAAAVGGVPEPASWALMLAGFGLTGVAVRRRKSIDRVTA